MMNNENKRIPVDHVEIVDSMPNVNEAPSDGENGGRGSMLLRITTPYLLMTSLNCLRAGIWLLYLPCPLMAPRMLLRYGRTWMRKIIF